jgi:hypothetical protein
MYRTIISKVKIAKNFPRTRVTLVIGLVFKISIVPERNSSANVFIVIAGIRKINIHGAREKKLVRSANPAFKILKSSSNTHRNNPFINKNIPIVK